MNQDAMAAVLKGARKCPDETRDLYFAFVADELRGLPNPHIWEVRTIASNGVKLFGFNAH